MTVTFPAGSIWDTRATYLAVPVNTVPGVMGAGMAKEAAERRPALIGLHKSWAKGGKAGGDVLFCGRDRAGRLPVVFVATKEDWRQPSRLEWVQRGLMTIRRIMASRESIALPLLGCGRGGLDPEEVERLIVAEFGGDPERVAEVYHG